jgi:DNA-binding GntR family transcriptional regulator
MNKNTTDNKDQDGLQPEVNQGRVSDIVYEKLRLELARGAYSPGTKVPIRTVAESLGVGSTPARDALKRLVFEGALLMSGPKTVIVPFLDLGTLDEVTQMRLALEGLAAEKATRHATADTIEKLEDIQKKINFSLEGGQYRDALVNNKEFHFTIYRLAAMPHLLATIENLWLRVGSSFHDLYPAFAEHRYGVHNHMVAIEGLLENDPAVVRAAMESDIRDGYRRLKRAALARAGQNRTTAN